MNMDQFFNQHLVCADLVSDQLSTVTRFRWPLIHLNGSCQLQRRGDFATFLL